MSITSPTSPGAGFQIPPAPRIPPTLEDVSNAVQYTREMLIAGGQSVVTKHDVAHAYMYQTSVLNARLKAIEDKGDNANSGRDVPPAWYTAGQETIQKAFSALEKKVGGLETAMGGRLDRLEKKVDGAVQKIDGLERKVARLEEKVGGLNQRVNEVCRLTAQSWNFQCGSGIGRPFKVVSFPDGSLPTDIQHKLPALLNAQDVTHLTAQQCTKYLDGYNLPISADITERKRTIALEIGCTHLVLS
ncbi:hypothetical protein K439DRAFT_1638895 [Ramaria rubella]|nr:hypothetical protein K439DRAFT_1638895 [Ramaria rubella]